MSQSPLRSPLIGLVTAVLSTHTIVASADDGCPADGQPAKAQYDGPGEKYQGCVGGAPYLIYVPKGWKAGGPLIMNMYGYWPTVPVVLSSPLAVYDVIAVPWLELGYAIAVSQSEYGWVPQKRIADTELLRQYFIEKFGSGIASSPSVISGFSMGGMQTYHVIETNRNYHGALAMCGFAMPSLSFLQKYVFSTRLLFDFYFPGVLAGSVFDFPDRDHTLKNTCEALRRYIPGGPTNFFCAPMPANPPLLYLNPQHVQEYLRMTSTPAVDQIPSKVALHTELLRELSVRLGGNIFDNTNEIYLSRPADNLLIPRRAATAKFTQEVEITGKLDRPVLAMHTYVDEFVPVETTRYYMDLTNQQGTAKNFVQLYTNGSGHCIFQPSELKAGLKLLDQWMRQNARPRPGDLLAAEPPH